MAISMASRGTPLSTSTNTTSYTMVDGGTPANGILLLGVVYVAGTPPVSTFAGYGQTWTLIGRGPGSLIELYACITASATSTAPVVTTSAGTGCLLYIIEVTGAYVSGTVLDAFEQQTAGVYVAGAQDTGGAATTLSVTLKAPDNSANRPFSSFAHLFNEGKTPRASWTELADVQHTAPTHGAESQYRSDAHETTASATWTTGANCEAYACAIRDASAPPSSGTEQFFPVVVGA